MSLSPREPGVVRTGKKVKPVIERGSMFMFVCLRGRSHKISLPKVNNEEEVSSRLPSMGWQARRARFTRFACPMHARVKRLPGALQSRAGFARAGAFIDRAAALVSTVV